MFRGKAKSPYMEILIKEERRRVMGTRMEKTQINPVVVKHEQIKQGSGRHTRIGVSKAIIQSSLPALQKM